MRVRAVAVDGENTSVQSRWIRLTFGGWCIGFVLAIVLILAAESIGVRETQFPLALGMGAGVGFAQARLLLPYLWKRWPWVVATALGLAAPFVVADGARGIGNPLPYALPAYVALGGVSAGILQWNLLRRVSEGAAWWLVASPVAWMAAATTVAVSDQVFQVSRRVPLLNGLPGALLYLAVVLAGGVLLGGAGAPAVRRIMAGSRSGP